MQLAPVGLVAPGHTGNLNMRHPARGQVLVQLGGHVTFHDLAVVEVHQHLEVGGLRRIEQLVRVILPVQKVARHVAQVDGLDEDVTPLARGLVGLAIYDSGPRCFYNTRHPIVQPRDLHGLKIRVPGDLEQLPVSKLIGQRIEPTLALTLCTLIIAVGLAVPLGVWLGHRHRGSFIAINASNVGRALPSLAVIAIGLSAVPVFVRLVRAQVLLGAFQPVAPPLESKVTRAW